MDHALRRARLAGLLERHGIDALLVTSLSNVRYLTGFTGSYAEAVVARDRCVLLTDGRYEEQARAEAPDVEVRIHLDTSPRHVVDACAAIAGRVGFEREGMTFGEWERLRDAAGAIELIPVTRAAESLREAKDPEELALIEAAQEATDVAFDLVVLHGLREGITERELALQLEIEMRRAGADSAGFEPIVAFGENGSEPHHHPCGRALRPGDALTVDVGAEVGGYRSDMTRTVAFGEPGARVRELHELVLRAQAAGIGAAIAGVPAAEVDAAARAVIVEAGLGEAFSHSVGHGVGLEIHEAPIMRRECHEPLRAGAVVTVEPGVYIPGVGGVRIEDMIEVSEEGRRTIPRTAKELIVL